MTKEEKTRVIGELKEKFASTTNFYITDASGLTVEQVNNFRKLCYQKGIEYKVIKNTLIKKALSDSKTDYKSFEGKVFAGFSGVLFSETGNAPAKLLKEFRKNGGEKPALKGASIDSALFFGEESLDVLSALKSKNELIGDIIGLLQSPAKTVIGALQSSGGKLAGILKTLEEKKQ